MALLDAFKFDLKEVAYRVAGTQILLYAKNKLLNMLRQRGINNDYIEKIGYFLDTDLGKAVLSTAVGVAVPYLPAFKNDKRVKSIAKEFRMGGLVFIANLLAERTLGDALPVFENITKHLFNYKRPSKIRIGSFKRVEFTPSNEDKDISETEENNQNRNERKQITLVS